jgi:excisionase family DNA binding protein
MATAQPRQLFYSTSEVASLLGCSGEHVRQLIARGEIRQHDGLGRKILIPCSEVARLAGTDEPPGHEVVSSSQHSEIIRELRHKFAEIGLLIAQLEED